MVRLLVFAIAMAGALACESSVFAKDQQIQEKIWLSRADSLYFAIRGRNRDGIGLYSFGRNVHGNWLHKGDGVKNAGNLFRNEVKWGWKKDGSLWIEFPYGRNNDWHYRIDVPGPIDGPLSKDDVKARKWREE